MMTPIASLLAAVLLVQASADQTGAGTIFDEQGKPIAAARVVLYAPPTLASNSDPAEAQALSDAEGKFRLNVPPLGRLRTVGVHVWAHRPGLAIAAVPYVVTGPHQIVVRNPESRTVLVEGPDGKPVAGARVQPRLVVFTGALAGADLPDSLASPLAATTGADGTATLTYLRARDRLVAARVTADTIGEQDLPVKEKTHPGAVGSSFLIKLNKTSRLAGRIVDQAGHGVANQAVEIWTRGGAGRFIPNLVGFKNGPVRTGADGKFQTPDNLMIGSSYRVAVREPGKEPIISDWVAVAEHPLTLAPLELRAFRSVSGRVVDRNSKAVANAEIFQSGNGPAPTAVSSDADGRFALNGFPHGPAFLFVRGEGFRFNGKLVKPRDRDVTVTLTRTTERPEHDWSKLPDAIPLEESRGMARRILDRWWNAAVDRNDESAKFFVAQFLIPADPVGALQKIGAIKFPTEKSRARLQSLAGRALARADFEEGQTVAESIVDPGVRAGTLAHLVDLLPGNDKPHKLAILERALIQAKATTTPTEYVYHLSQVAVRLLELGEIDKAKEIFAEGLRRAKEFNDVSVNRCLFAGLLAKVDLTGAMELARPLAGNRPYGSMICSSIAFGLPWHKPAEANQFLSQFPPDKGPHWLLPVVIWKIATLDPARARRLADTCREERSYFEYEFCLALGAKGRDPTIATAAIHSGLQELDRVLRDDPQVLTQYGGELLAIVEAIDPTLVAEVMWRAIAARPLSGNPRAVQGYAPVSLAEHLAWYDRGVAAALLDPLLKRIDKASDQELIDWDAAFETWTLFDPRAAVARLERIPMKSVDPNDNRLWIYVIRALALDHDERWRRTFSRWAPIFNPANRDFMLDRF